GEVLQPRRPRGPLAQRAAEQVQGAAPQDVAQRVAEQRGASDLDVAGGERDDADGGHARVRLEQVAGSGREQVDVRADARPERAAALELALRLPDPDLHDVAVELDA